MIMIYVEHHGDVLSLIMVIYHPYDNDSPIARVGMPQYVSERSQQLRPKPDAQRKEPFVSDIHTHTGSVYL